MQIPEHPSPGGELQSVRNGHVMRFAGPKGAVLPYVLNPLLSGEYYEERLLRHVRSLGLEGVYVDVGAHVGTHSVWFGVQCLATHVHAFEPVTRYAAVLQKNLHLNELTDRVTIHAEGLSDVTGIASNVLARTHQEGFVECPEEITETFPVRRLDDVLGPEVRVVIMKLDVEGMEPSVLRGAARILKDHSPVVFAEARDALEYQSLAAALAEQGYQPTGRIFNATPTYEFRKPNRFWQQLGWRLRLRAHR